MTVKLGLLMSPGRSAGAFCESDPIVLSIVTLIILYQGYKL